MNYIKYLLRKLKAVYFAIEFILSVVITYIFFLFFKNDQDKIWKIIKFWAKSQIFASGAKVEIVGQADENAQMIIANHQSILDIVVLEANYPRNLCFVAKREIGDVPVFGSVMRMSQQISIDRKDKRSSVKILKDAKERLAQGRIIAMFPEGTRNDGKNILEFKDGAKMLANKLDLKVQPIVLVNTLPVMDSKSFSSRAATIKIVYLPLVDKNNSTWLEDAQKNMQEILTKELKNLGELE